MTIIFFHRKEKYAETNSEWNLQTVIGTIKYTIKTRQHSPLIELQNLVHKNNLLGKCFATLDPGDGREVHVKKTATGDQTSCRVHDGR